MKILFTGACGVFVKYLAESLPADWQKNIFLADMNHNKLRKIKKYKIIHIPKATDLNFTNKIAKVIKNNQIKIVVSVVDEELLKLSRLSKKLKFIVIQPKYNFISFCLDKYQCGKKLYNEGINNYKTYLLNNYNNEFEFPIILKPRHGRGSRGVYIVKNLKSFNLQKKKIIKLKKKNQYVVQKCFKGKEYTVSVVCNESNTDYNILPKRIILKKGVTRKAITEKNKFIISKCKKIIKKFKPSGPFNVQCIVYENNVEIFEINPRFSTSSTLSIAAGLSEVKLMIYSVLKKNINLKKINWKVNVKLTRTRRDKFTNL